MIAAADKHAIGVVIKNVKASSAPAFQTAAELMESVAWLFPSRERWQVTGAFNDGIADHCRHLCGLHFSSRIK